MKTAYLERMRLAVVHPHSGHNYELRYWLSACGIDPDTDIEIVIVPPPLMVDALGAERIDGYCVGEPWNTAVVAKGVGRIVTVKAAIWKSSPEKVLGIGLRKRWRSPVRHWRAGKRCQKRNRSSCAGRKFSTKLSKG